MKLKLLATNASQHSRKVTLVEVGSTVTLVLMLQIWTASSLLERTDELRRILSTSHADANQLERRIGYGGLIHNFKNYFLRPKEDKYRLAAQVDARDALLLIEKLRKSAAEFGIAAPLEQTRKMIESYAQRLDSVRQMVKNNRSRAFIDEQVRYDDQPALVEVDTLLNQLEFAIDNRLVKLQKEAAIGMALIIGCSLLAASLFIVFLAIRQKKHLDASREQPDRLSSTNESLSRANGTLNQFAGIVSHDLKGPLHHLSYFCEVLTESLHDSHKSEDYIEKTQTCVGNMHGNMHRIIDCLLEFSRTGFTQPCFETIELPTLVADIEQSLQSDIRDCNARLNIDLDIHEPIQADYALLVRVFSNLIANSLKYRRADVAPVIEVRGVHVNDGIELSVSDTGISIDPGFSDRIFQPLQQLHESQEEYTGSGTGLSLVKSIVEGHRGQIRLDAEYTTGTRIAFTLPCQSSQSWAKVA